MWAAARNNAAAALHALAELGAMSARTGTAGRQAALLRRSQPASQPRRWCPGRTPRRPADAARGGPPTSTTPCPTGRAPWWWRWPTQPGRSPTTCSTAAPTRTSPARVHRVEALGPPCVHRLEALAACLYPRSRSALGLPYLRSRSALGLPYLRSRSALGSGSRLFRSARDSWLPPPRIARPTACPPPRTACRPPRLSMCRSRVSERFPRTRHRAANSATPLPPPSMPLHPSTPSIPDRSPRPPAPLAGRTGRARCPVRARENRRGRVAAFPPLHRLVGACYALAPSRGRAVWRPGQDRASFGPARAAACGCFGVAPAGRAWYAFAFSDAQGVRRAKDLMRIGR